MSGFTNGYSLHHKHIAKQCNIGKVIRYNGKNMKVVRFFIDDMKKDIVVWAGKNNSIQQKHICIDSSKSSSSSEQDSSSKKNQMSIDKKQTKNKRNKSHTSMCDNSISSSKNNKRTVCLRCKNNY